MVRRLHVRLLSAFRPYPSLALLALFGLVFLAPSSAFAQAGHGNWSIQATYSGSASSTVSAVTPIIYDCKVQGVAIGANQSLPLSTINNSPLSTVTGGITSKLQADLHYKTAGPGNHTAQLAFSNAQVTFRLVYQPKTNEAPPAQVFVWYRRTVVANASAAALLINPSIVQQGGASPNDAEQSATATATTVLGGLSLTSTATSPGTSPVNQSQPDANFIKLPLSVDPMTGVASVSFSLSGPQSVELDHGTAVAQAEGEAH